MTTQDVIFIGVLYIPVVIYNIYWSIKYLDFYLDVVLFRTPDIVFSLLTLIFNVFPFIAWMLFRLIYATL